MAVWETDRRTLQFCCLNVHETAFQNVPYFFFVFGWENNTSAIVLIGSLMNKIILNST